MSDSTSVPAGGDTTDAGHAAPAATSTLGTPGLSISDAARMLARQRAAARPPRDAQAAPQQPPPAPAAPPNAAATPPSGPSPQPRPAGEVPRGVAAMAEALGLRPPTGADSGDADSVSRETPDTAAAPIAGPIDLDGRQWSPDALREQIRLAADYTQKTQAVAARAREVEAQQQALAQFLPFIQPELEALQRRIAEAPRPDPQLRQTDPGAYWDQFARWQEAQAEQQRVMGVMNAQSQARNAAMAQQVEQANAELAAKYPFWADPAQRREVQQDIIAYARATGYSDAELQSLTSARYLETLMKASLYDKHVAGIRTRAPVPAVAQAPVRGAPPPPQPAQAIVQAQQAFDQTPNVRNAAALIGARRASRPNGHTNW